MEVIKNQIDDLNIELTIALKAEDYAEQERKRLAAYRRNADFKGFRKGMVPPTLVKKIYPQRPRTWPRNCLSMSWTPPQACRRS